MYRISNAIYNEMDRGIRDTIVVLNRKNFGTDASCEGHLTYLRKNSRRIKIFICFLHYSMLDDFSVPIPQISNEDNPNGAYTEIDVDMRSFRIDRRVTYWWYGREDGTDEEKEQERKEWLEKLRDWANSLKPRELTFKPVKFFIDASGNSDFHKDGYLYIGKDEKEAREIFDSLEEKEYTTVRVTKEYDYF